MHEWLFTRDGFDPEAEAWREAIFTLGNGYLATRGAAPEAVADGVHYPGTYVAGCYNRLESRVDSRKVENEDLVNVPNWLPLTFRVEDGEWFSPGSVELLDYRQELDMRAGTLSRRLRFSDPGGRVTAVTQRRVVSMHEPHLAGLRTTFEAENWTGRLTVRAALDGRVTNTGVERYRDLASAHLSPVTRGHDDDLLWLQVETTTSRVRIAEAARVTVDLPVDEVERSVIQEDDWIGVELGVEVAVGTPCTVDKAVAVFTSRDNAIEESLPAACTCVRRAESFDDLAAHHQRAWHRLWNVSHLRVGGEPQRTLNLHLFHLLQTVSEHTVDLDVGIPARGLHGEAYRGHIFWDELFVLPLLSLWLPEVARNLLLYRWRRLPAAQWAARNAGLRGAMYPWQSSSDGREETQQMHLNPRSGSWLPDNSDRQRHVGHAIAYNVWKYYEATGDMSFLSQYGAEMLLEMARFWGSVATHNEDLDRYDIRGVVGPDEYHDAYPQTDRPGVDNNAYTNVMASWVINRALDVLALLPEPRQAELCEQLHLGDEEIKRLATVSRRMRVVFTPDGIVDQFEGFHELAEFDWDSYGDTYGDIRRLDRILEAEGDSTNNYQVCKQADVLMLLFLLGEQELLATFTRLEYQVDHAMLERTLQYYLERTSHGSTLSAVVHAWILARSDPERSWRFFLDALASDVEDVQGGTTQEGIHLGAMAGTVDLLQRCYTGLDIRDGVLRLEPRLPPELKELELRLTFRAHAGIEVACTHDRVWVHLPQCDANPIAISINGRTRVLSGGDEWDAVYDSATREVSTR